jgi:glycosyl hydrolase family 115 (putative glucuronidase)/glycosyl hydrolase family 115
MRCIPLGEKRVILGVVLAVLGSAALLGCGKTSHTPGLAPDSGQPDAPGMPAPQPVIDPWHHRPGAGEVIEPGPLIATSPTAGAFTLAEGGAAPPLIVSAADLPGVVRVVGDLRDDIARVTQVTPRVINDAVPADAPQAVLIGTLGNSPLVDQLVGSGQLDVHDVAGRWETFVIQVVDAPMPGLARALVIAGSDQRGTIYGAYEISRQIGVSPWYFWDDVPPPHHDALYVTAARYTLGTPAVKYRGVFINDENPQLGGWGPAHFGPGKAPGFPGGFNSALYARVFETLLRLRANYLWPAVWGRAFAEDDPQSHAVATRYGIVMGTSHEAPMLRGIEEWNRHPLAYGGTGDWRFSTNRAAVTAYMRDGAQRMKDQNIEGVITMGMRGPGDVSLPPEDGVPLIQDLIGTQQQMLADVFGGDTRSLPKVWTLYKEVQDWYLRPDGIQVPDDITLVWADDNWGNMRKLPDQTRNPERFAGYGIYYHFDYVGTPRNYKWVDTTLLSSTWEQLDLAYGYGVDRLWVVNVGDLKDAELPAEFFLDYAWSPGRWPVTRLGEWTQRWAAEQFGPEHAAAIGDVLHRYQLLQSDRKPELLNRLTTWNRAADLRTDPDTALVYSDADPFSLVDYAEHQRIAADWQQLAADADQVGSTLPALYRDPYYELVLYKVKATANLYALRLAQFTGSLYADQGRAATNDLAATAIARFQDDQAMNDFYNQIIAGGRWACTPDQAPCTGWASQPHLGYGKDSPWQEPEIGFWAAPDFIWPELRQIALPDAASMGVAIDGSTAWWPGGGNASPVLPVFSPYQTQSAQYIDVFDRGAAPFDVAVAIPASFAGVLTVTPKTATVDKELRLALQVDWAMAPGGRTTVPITITGSEGSQVVVSAVLDNRPVLAQDTTPGWEALNGFVEANGHVAMEAEHFTSEIEGNGVSWLRIPDIGRTGAGMTVVPRNAALQTPGRNAPHLEYQMYLLDDGDRSVEVWTYLSPRNSVRIASGDQDGLLFAVSIDGEAPQVVNATQRLAIDPQANSGNGNKPWEWKSADNIIRIPTTHRVSGPNPHVLNYWVVDPTVIVQKFVIDTGGLQDSYLGPPESCRAPAPCRIVDAPARPVAPPSAQRPRAPSSAQRPRAQGAR